MYFVIQDLTLSKLPSWKLKVTDSATLILISGTDHNISIKTMLPHNFHFMVNKALFFRLKTGPVGVDPSLLTVQFSLHHRPATSQQYLFLCCFKLKKGNTSNWGIKQ